MKNSGAPIGIFDSGVGGLSVLRALREVQPAENLIYLADQAHVPYGARPLQEVQQFAEAITAYLLDQGAKMIVVACNTASAAALHHLRGKFPSVPFVGMEPALKPAAESSLTGKVGVLATEVTFQGSLYSTLLERFGSGVAIHEDSCLGLVGQIEAGDLGGQKTRRILSAALGPMLDAGIDTIVLGCTHYPFVIPLIKDLAGPGVRVIDPSPAVARQAGRLLKQHDLQNPGPARGWLRVQTTGRPAHLARLLPLLLGWSGAVQGLDWIAGELR